MLRDEIEKVLRDLIVDVDQIDGTVLDSVPDAIDNLTSQALAEIKRRIG